VRRLDSGSSRGFGRCATACPWLSPEQLIGGTSLVRPGFIAGAEAAKPASGVCATVAGDADAASVLQRTQSKSQLLIAATDLNVFLNVISSQGRSRSAPAFWLRA
jgi:hypothetical protein